MPDFFSGGDSAQSISGETDLSAMLFAVPPNAQVIFEAALSLGYGNDGGNIEADFESGDFQIMCPFVALSLLNSPPVVVG